MSLGQRLLHEFKSAAMVTLYFLFCFGAMLMIMKLFVARYDIELSALSKVVIGALIIGKVVVLLDNTSWGNRFHHHRAIYGIIYQSLIYTVIVLAVALLEQLYHAYSETGTLAAAITHLVDHRVEGRFLAMMLLIGLCFVAFNTVMAFDRVLGKGTVRKVLWGQRDPPTKSGS